MHDADETGFAEERGSTDEFGPVLEDTFRLMSASCTSGGKL